MPVGQTGFGEFLVGQIGSGASNAAQGGISGVFGQATNYVISTGIIGYQELVAMLQRGYISGDNFETLRRRNGMDGESLEYTDQLLFKTGPNWPIEFNNGNWTPAKHVNDRFVMINKNMPSPDEVLILINRGLIGPGSADFILNHQFSGESALVEAWKQLRFQVPGPSDLIHFAVRDCFSPDIVTTFQYNKELPVAILPYMQWQGLHGQIEMPMPPGSTTTVGADNRNKPQWFDMYWWSHWTLPSIGQGLEMLHRLYLDSSHGPAPGVTETNEFNITAMELLLKANDYPPFWRQRLIDISYAPLTRVDVRRMYDLFIVNEEEVYHAYRAIGYDDENANRLVQFAIKLRTDKITKPLRDRSAKEAHDLFMMGGISAEDAKNILLSAGFSESTLDGMISIWTLERKKKLLKDSISYIKAAFISGTFGTVAANQAMMNLGLPQGIRDEYTQLWDRIRYTKRKFLSAAANGKHFQRGLISENTYRIMLSNLNFDKAEIDRIVAFDKATMIQTLAKQQEAANKEIQKQQDKAREMLLKPYTDANIKKWYKAGLLSLGNVYLVLKMKGWIRPAAINFIVAELGEEITPEEADTLDKQDETPELLTQESEDTNE